MTNSRNDDASLLYRQQIQNISRRMSAIAKEINSHPLSRKSFEAHQGNFDTVLIEANSFCSQLDLANSIANEDKAIASVLALMAELIELKNKAGKLLNDDVLLDHIAIAILDQISFQHSSVINADHVLKEGMAELIESFVKATTSTMNNGERIISHMINQINEGTADVAMSRYIRQYITFKRALEAFRTNHMPKN